MRVRIGHKDQFKIVCNEVIENCNNFNVNKIAIKKGVDLKEILQNLLSSVNSWETAPRDLIFFETSFK